MKLAVLGATGGIGRSLVAAAAAAPTGSGEVESAHRYIPQKRMKIPGACWSPATINPMLALRVMRENDWWEPFWESEAPQDTV